MNRISLYCISFQVCFNADGHVLNPLFLNSGRFHQITMKRHLGRIAFVASPKGVVHRDVLLFMMFEIKRYMVHNNIQGPVVLWIAPRLFEAWSLLAWMAARKSGIIVETIPQHLYDSYRLTNRGIFDRLSPAIDREMDKR